MPPRGRSSHHSHHSSLSHHHHIPISHHHYHSTGGGRRTVRLLSPAEVAYNAQLTEMEAKIEPKASTKFIFRLAGFLQFATLPLLFATIGNPWYLVEADSNIRWDGSTDPDHNVQAGKLMLFEYQDCVESWSDVIDWYFCNLYPESIADSDADPGLKAASGVALAFVVICILSNVILCFRHFWTFGNRLLRKGDEWYIKWTKITSYQVAIHGVLILIAEAFYRQTVPVVIENTIGSGKHRFGPGIDVGIAAMIFSFLSVTLYNRYVKEITVHAATNTLPEVPPAPTPLAPQEAAMQWANQLGQQYAAGMMTAQQQQQQQQMGMGMGNNGAPGMVPMPMDGNGVPLPNNGMGPGTGMGMGMGMPPPNMMMPPMGGFIPGPNMMMPPPGFMPSPGMMMMPPSQQPQQGQGIPPNMGMYNNPNMNGPNPMGATNAPKDSFMYNNTYFNNNTNMMPSSPTTMPQQPMQQPTMPMGMTPMYPPYYQNPNTNSMPNNMMTPPPVTMPFNGTGYPLNSPSMNTTNTTTMYPSVNMMNTNNIPTDEPSAMVENSSRDLTAPNSLTTTTTTTRIVIKNNYNEEESSGNLNDNPIELMSPTVTVITNNNNNNSSSSNDNNQPPPSAPTIE